MNKRLKSLYDPNDVRDACGFGLLANIHGTPSRELVEKTIEALTSMTHRGALCSDNKTGDGCGILMAKPDKFFRAEAKRLFNADLNLAYAVGTFFLNQDAEKANVSRNCVERELRAEQMRVIGWRKVPVDVDVLGPQARESMPRIEQVFINANRMPGAQMQAKLYAAARRAELALHSDSEFYIVSLSRRVTLYKGLVTPEQLSKFYLDFTDPLMESSICVFHQRFATNTLPRWPLAQPFRMVAHNGEINTIEGNRFWSKVRAPISQSKLLPSLASLPNTLQENMSDSASFDNVLEQLITAGVDPIRAMRMMVPPAWQNATQSDTDIRSMFEYMSLQMEPWDGPAGLVMTNGRFAICALDRNGLRPARYVLGNDGTLVVASETGVVDMPVSNIKRKGRLGPGDILAVDTRYEKLMITDEINRRLAREHPYKQWIKDSVTRLEANTLSASTNVPTVLPELEKHKIFYQLTLEEQVQVMRPLAESGLEGVGSMGDDTPVAVLSTQNRPLYDFFRQRFAQVTNPPIDSLRETIAMSLETAIGCRQNPLQNIPEHARKIILQSPLLAPYKYQMLQDVDQYGLRTIDLVFTNNADEEGSLLHGIQEIFAKVERALEDGIEILVLREPPVSFEPSESTLPIHALIATGAVHHHLISIGKRSAVSLVIETGSARDSHQIATLIGYGADAVYPWLAYNCILQMTNDKFLSGNASTNLNNYRKGINKGLLKILSKMGISTISSYRGAQLFEVIGLDTSVTDLCFKGCESDIVGLTLQDIEEKTIDLHKTAQSTDSISVGGILKYVHNSEYHCFNPDVIANLQQSVKSGEKSDWIKYSELIEKRPVSHFRDLLEPAIPESPDQIKGANSSVDLDSVEAIEDITPRFDSAGMSLGALSPEAHSDLARAMNSLNCRSNSGEGGEHPDRLNSEANSKIKQVASGRFGVTPTYLRSAEVIQIKIAQGAKPGEGGQLPGRKVNSLIAKLRFSVPGVTLISPPPHHDIYSIEDLAQLIYDLKQINPKAQVSVKLVSSTGIGTIAAGVVKAGADLITISGYDGGTAASPLSSIRYAGGPWEMGLARVQQTLCANGLRQRVRLQVDGGLKAGLDVIKAAILGADSFGFGTAPMVALGCKYLRICHLNNCATGIATQDERLRENHYIGTYDMVRNFFMQLSQEVREWMAQLGVTNLDSIIGQTQYLRPIAELTEKYGHVDLSRLLAREGDLSLPPHFVKAPEPKPIPLVVERILESCLDDAIGGGGGTRQSMRITNQDRTVGARLAGEIADVWGDRDFPGTPIRLKFRGTAGQSFGAFNVDGMELKVEGECNDYVGKGMAGGVIVVAPPPDFPLPSNEAPIVGNTCLYGATGGQAYIAGTVGERFAVRNSGATAVAEGAGQHCCEYMTGGQVVICGPVGQNFGAGMTGGLAYVLDEDRDFVDKVNTEMVSMHRLTTEDMEEHRGNLIELLQKHASLTDSLHTKRIVENFEKYVHSFWIVAPRATSIEALLQRVRADAA